MAGLPYRRPPERNTGAGVERLDHRELTCPTLFLPAAALDANRLGLSPDGFFRSGGGWSMTHPQEPRPRELNSLRTASKAKVPRTVA
jgi:hypothetical protein